MPKSTAPAPSPARSAAAAPVPDSPAEPPLRAAADALFRAALECCRQHARYARLVEHDASEAEQRAACKMVELADELLQEMARAYERVAAPAAGPDEPWWHRANMLLLASRDFLRHHERCDKATRLTSARSHSVADLDALTAGYELEASALLALQQALDGYRRARPEAELRSNGSRPA